MNKILSILLVVNILLFNACQKPSIDLTNHNIKIIGHGGMGFESPENSLPHNSVGSITKAIEGHSIDGVEIDIQMTKDSVLFMYHDQLLETMTNCNSCVSEYDSVQLNDCQFRSAFTLNSFTNEELVMPLEFIIERFSKRTIKPDIFLDTRTTTACLPQYKLASIARSLSNLISKYEAQDWIKIESSNLNFLSICKNLNPDLKLHWETMINEQNINIAISNNFDGFTIINSSVSSDDIDLVHQSNLHVSVFGAKIRENMIDAINKNPDYIYTDNIELLKQILY